MVKKPSPTGPSYSLQAFQKAAADPVKFDIKMSARQGGAAIGYATKAAICAVLQRIRPAEFYKTMPGIQDPLIMHDVYHTTDSGRVIYIKFVYQAGAFRLLSFKEK